MDQDLKEIKRKKGKNREMRDIEKIYAKKLRKERKAASKKQRKKTMENNEEINKASRRKRRGNMKIKQKILSSSRAN